MSDSNWVYGDSMSSKSIADTDASDVSTNVLANISKFFSHKMIFCPKCGQGMAKDTTSYYRSYYCNRCGNFFIGYSDSTTVKLNEVEQKIIGCSQINTIGGNLVK